MLWEKIHPQWPSDVLGALQQPKLKKPLCELMARRAVVPEVAGIYAIAKGEKLYIGSSRNLRARLAVHIRHLRNQHHHADRLQADFDVHGPSAFEFIVLDLCEGHPNELMRREQVFMDTTESWKPERGYNCSRFAVVGKGSHPLAADIQKFVERTQVCFCFQYLDEPPVHGINLRRFCREHDLSYVSMLCLRHAPEKFKAHKGWHLPSTLITIYNFTAPGGAIVKTHSLKKLCEQHGLSESAMLKVWQGRNCVHRGWRHGIPKTSRSYERI